MSRSFITVTLAGCLALSTASGAALADDGAASTPFGAAQAVSETDLSAMRGGESFETTFVTAWANTAVTNTNSSSYSSGGATTTGNVNIGEGALRHSGLGNYLINTGISSNLGAAIGLSISVYNGPLP